MKKRIAIVLLCLIMAICLLPTAVFAAPDDTFTVGDFNYKVITDPSESEPGTVELTGCAGSVTDINLDTITNSADSYKVTSVGVRAFEGRTAIVNVSLPAVTYIGENAFVGCTALETTVLPAVTYVEKEAFQGCTALKDINIQAATAIGENAFQNCILLTSINLPAATEIGERAFKDCTSLANINLPAALNIKDHAFEFCHALTSIDLPAATSIGDFSFLECIAVKTVNLPVATSIGMGAFSDNSALTSANVPSATQLAPGVFQNCAALTSIDLPVATSVAQYTFENCTSLVSVNMPAVTKIEYAIFQGCTALESIDLSLITTIEGNAFNNCTSLISVIAMQMTAPTLDASAFNGVPATCTVYVPYGATGFDAAGWPASKIYLCEVSGTVYDEAGNPAADIIVYAGDAMTKTDATGKYTVYVNQGYTGNITATLASGSTQSITLTSVNSVLTEQDIFFATVATPTFSLAAGTYSSNQTVTILCSTEGATIRYTIDGAEPTETSPEYTAAISIIEGNTVVKAKAFKDKMNLSATAEAKYTVTVAVAPPVAPAISTIPATGDTTPTILWIVLMLITSSAIIALAISKKHKNMM